MFLDELCHLDKLVSTLKFNMNYPHRNVVSELPFSRLGALQEA